MNITDEHLPLTGVRVLDLVYGPMAVIGRQLAELGAEVIRVEPREGADDRHQAPRVHGVSLPFVTANLGKQSLALDVADPADVARFKALLAQADIVLHMPGDAVDDPEVLRAEHPHLVIMSVSDFGQNSPLRDWQATALVLYALSGALSRYGNPGLPPLPPPGELALACAAWQALPLVLLALFNRLRGGEGDWLDFSVLDGVSHALDPGYGIAGSATAGVPASQLPRGRPEARFMYPIIPCRDGHVRICVLAPRQWQGMFKWLGEPDAFADPAFNSLQHRFASPDLIPAIARLFSDKTREQLEQQGQSFGVPIAGVLSVDEAVACEQIKARRAFVPAQIANGVSTLCLDGMFEIDGRRTGIRGPAPELGQHHGFSSERSMNVPVNPAPDPRPLSGLRVLDLGVIIVGAEQGRLLADQGADVIKLETSAFPDGARQTLDNARMSISFAAGHRNKRGLGLNLRSEAGKALFRELVKHADIVLSNFKPGTLESLGLGNEALLQLNPSLILADSSAFGPAGPWSRRMGYGPLVRAASGLIAQWNYPEERAGFGDASAVYPDHVASQVGVAGVLALLIRRLRSGRGGTVSVSQMEVILGHMANLIAARQISGAAMPAPVCDAPWGVYPCVGDDEWCALTVRDDADWQVLCRVIERPDLAADAALATSSGRAAQRERVDTAVRAWLAEWSPQAAMQRLQEAGVPAGAMLRVPELPEFAHYRGRSFFRETTHPLIDGPFLLENAPVRSQRLPDPPDAPAPVIAGHTAEIVREWLGLDEDAIRHLLDEGAIELA